MAIRRKSRESVGTVHQRECCFGDWSPHPVSSERRMRQTNSKNRLTGPNLTGGRIFRWRVFATWKSRQLSDDGTERQLERPI
jgi:hypothetical protein